MDLGKLYVPDFVKLEKKEKIEPIWVLEMRRLNQTMPDF